MVIHPDGSFGFSPEYESCKEIALKHGFKLSEVIRAIEHPKESGL
jgi:uncharacterized protein (DUF111 family)